MSLLSSAYCQARYHHARLFRRMIVAVGSLAAVTAGCSGLPTPGFPPQPSSEAVGQPVLVSADAKTISSFAPIVCGRHAELVALSFPHKVTLTLFNPASGCNAEIIAYAVARTTLRAPLGGRALVQASDGTAIPYFSERDLAQATALPGGYRLSSDLPTDYSDLAIPEPGDTRTYTAASGRLLITQIAPLKGIFPLAQWPWPGRVLVGGQPARLIVDRIHGLVTDRSITWVSHGYRFIVTAGSAGQHPAPLSAQLAAIAGGLVLKPSQYR